MKNLLVVISVCLISTQASADLFDALNNAAASAAKEQEASKIAVGVDDRHIASTTLKRENSTKVVTVESSIATDDTSKDEVVVEDENMARLDAATEGLVSLTKELSDKGE